ncbi:MAG: hypothetical protein E7019_06305 [Alphaproteobacteria bacterium]|nr:hypothetical protein [Alphaproteobacteria bacterium]
MRQKVTNRNNNSANYTLPAPTGGLNARDSLDTMSEIDAVVMDNYLPSDTKVSLRKGYITYANLDYKILTLAEYSRPAFNRFFAFGGGNVWDITSKNNIKKIKDGFGNNQWQYIQFRNRLILVNGQDKPQTFYIDENEQDCWCDAAFEGDNLHAEKLINVAVSKQRLFFVEKGSLSVWYSQGVGEVQGTLTKLDMSSIFQCGGELISVASWTQDGGQGVDDLTVFITSKGEVAVYSGNDPSNSDDWFLKGVYQMSRPIGYRCTLQYQGDVVIISEDGYVPLSKALSQDKANASQISFSDKIRGLVLERTKNGKNKSGWQGIIYGRGGYAIFNVPVSQQFEQHVVNLNGGSWCRFTGIRSFCWGSFGDRIYFGGDNGVFLFDEGYSDNGAHICGVVEQAFSNLGNPNLKRIQLINPRTKSSTKYALVVYTNMDFEERKVSYAETIGSGGITKWENAGWSCLKRPIGTKWATLKGKIRNQWIGNSATGFKASVVFKTKTKGNIIEWFDTGFRYEQGSNIL